VTTATLSNAFQIGGVAKLSALSVKTIRYYTDIGLLEPHVERSPTRYRLYSPEVLERLAFIRRSQSLGLSLTEIQDILEIHDRGVLPCGQAKQYLESKLDEIETQIRHLEVLRTEIKGVLLGWKQPPLTEYETETICPNLQTA
jgi:MerR family transcriptional regulator, copper efflux regulator